MEQKIGVMVPTFSRPDLARFSALQLLAQTMLPDLIYIHQNGNPESYEWVIHDLERSTIKWLHTPEVIPQHEWYSRPLAKLIEEGCTHFFWVDHDDLYLRHHIQKSMAELSQGYDFTIQHVCGILKNKPPEYRYYSNHNFTAHLTGGMSSSMAFNRPFAQALLKDLEAHPEILHSDNVVANITKPKFRCFSGTENPSSIYVCHEQSLTSKFWLEHPL